MATKRSVKTNTRPSLAARFNSNNRTPAYLAAIKALKQLSLDLRERAFCEAAVDEWRKNFAERHGVQVTDGGYWWGELLGRRRPDYDPGIPGDDHTELWMGKGEGVYVSHPYDLTLETLRAIVKHCDQNGLDVRISGGSWHYPGSTVLVVYKKAETDE